MKEDVRCMKEDVRRLRRSLNFQLSRLRLSERKAMLASALPSVSRLEAQPQFSI